MSILRNAGNRSQDYTASQPHNRHLRRRAVRTSNLRHYVLSARLSVFLYAVKPLFTFLCLATANVKKIVERWEKVLPTY
jgi:hypothetical protein